MSAQALHPAFSPRPSTPTYTLQPMCRRLRSVWAMVPTLGIDTRPAFPAQPLLRRPTPVTVFGFRAGDGPLATRTSHATSARFAVRCPSRSLQPARRPYPAFTRPAPRANTSVDTAHHAVGDGDVDAAVAWRPTGCLDGPHAPAPASCATLWASESATACQRRGKYLNLIVPQTL